jgi:hypothetical protein
LTKIVTEFTGVFSPLNGLFFIYFKCLAFMDGHYLRKST